MGEGRRIIAPQKTQARMISCPCDQIFFGGARGGGKSFSCLIHFVAHAKKHGKKAKGIIFRRTYPELEDFLDQSREVLPHAGFIYKVKENMWVHPVGAFLKLRYLDRDADAMSYQGHNYSVEYFDEAGNWPSPDPIDKLFGAVRSKGGVRGQQILTGNPGGPGHQWLKTRFIDPVEPGKVQRISIPLPDGSKEEITRVFIPSRLEDNQELMRNDPTYVARLSLTGSKELVRAWLEGDWNIVAGAFFADVWSARNVLTPFEMPGTWPKFRAFDWGSSAPFATVWYAEANGEQAPDGPHIPRGSIVVFAEDYGWNGKPNEGLRLSVTEIARRIKAAEAGWPFKVHPGPADSAIFAMENGQSIIDDFRKAGVDWTPSEKGPGSRAAGWQKMRDLLRAAGSKDEPGLYIFSTCRHLIRTLPNIPRDDKKWDDVDTNAEDHCFAAGTMVDTPSGPVKIEDLPESGLVYTAFGRVARYRNARLTRENAKTVTVFLSNGKKITCTPDHMFLTPQGWIMAKDLDNALRYGIIGEWKQSSFTRVLRTIFAGSIFNIRALGFTEKSGKIKTGQFLRAIMSIILMGIARIIPLKTLSALLPRNTLEVGTENSTQKRLNLPNLLGERRQNCGTNQNKEENGTKHTTKSIKRTCTEKLKRLAQYVAGLFLGLSGKKMSFVQTNANPKPEGFLGSTTSKRFVQSAELPLLQINTEDNRRVPKSVQVRCVKESQNQDVYCLTVDSTECFSIEGGVLVHNCIDALRYALVSAKREVKVGKISWR